jgi:hypothetical protein
MVLLVFPFGVEAFPGSSALPAEISLEGSALTAVDRPTAQAVMSVDCPPFVEFVEDVDATGTHGALPSKGNSCNVATARPGISADVPQSRDSARYANRADLNLYFGGVVPGADPILGQWLREPA